MKLPAHQLLLTHLLRADQSMTLLINRTLKWRTIRPFFRFISGLGDGKLWYILMSGCAVFGGLRGIIAALQMGLTALVTLLSYKLVKGATQRPRPGAVHAAVREGIDPLDEYSFPSGHTMQAAAFTLIASAWYPGLAPILIPFTALTGLSRIVLGLHYPTDVLLGACFGTLIGYMSLVLWAVT